MAAFTDALSRLNAETASLLEKTGGAGGDPSSPTVNPAMATGIQGLQSAIAGLSNPTAAMSSAVAAAGAGLFAGLFSTRVVAIVLGLLFIAGAFILFGADEIFSTVKKVPEVLAA